MYGNGRGAMSIFSLSGEPVDKITVNLPERTLEPDTFFVKANRTIDATDFVYQAHLVLLKTGFFEVKGRPQPSGFVPEYALQWRFAKSYPEAPGTDGYRILNNELRNGFLAIVEEETKRRRAQEAADRLNGRFKQRGGQKTNGGTGYSMGRVYSGDGDF